MSFRFKSADLDKEMRSVAESTLRLDVNVIPQNSNGTVESGSLDISSVFNRKFTSIARAEIGGQITLRLVPLSKYRSLQTWQTVDDLRPNFELPLYTPKLD